MFWLERASNRVGTVEIKQQHLKTWPHHLLLGRTTIFLLVLMGLYGKFYGFYGKIRYPISLNAGFLDLLFVLGFFFFFPQVYRICGHKALAAGAALSMDFHILPNSGR